MTDELEGLSDAEFLDLLLRRLEGRGEDTAAMRRDVARVAALEVGDPTPLPGALRRPVVLPDPTAVIFDPPLHNGLNEPPEGKFYRRRSSGLIVPVAGDGSRQTARLGPTVRRHGIALTLLWMCFVSLVVTLVHAWRPGWP